MVASTTSLHNSILLLVMHFKDEDFNTVKIEHTHCAQVKGLELEHTDKAKLPILNDIKGKEPLHFVIDYFTNSPTPAFECIRMKNSLEFSPETFDFSDQSF